MPVSRSIRTRSTNSSRREPRAIAFAGSSAHARVVGPGSAATFDLVVESPGAYPLVTHSLTAALRGAIAVLVVSPDAKPAPLMPQTPWRPDLPAGEIMPPTP